MPATAVAEAEAEAEAVIALKEHLDAKVEVYIDDYAYKISDSLRRRILEALDRADGKELVM